MIRMYDLRVKITPVGKDEIPLSEQNLAWPRFDKAKALPNFTPASKMSSYSSHPNINISRGWRDIFSRGEK